MEEAPVPSTHSAALSFITPTKDASMTGSTQTVVSVTIAGCGGCGINFARHFAQSRNAKTLFFDTSVANLRGTEKANIVTNGSGSGGHRAENAKNIEREIPQLNDEEIGKADVAIVVFSSGGGSGSVLGPLLIREYNRRGQRAIGVVITDTSSAVDAKNTQNTLKTLYAVAKNNDIYLPLIVLSNDNVSTNREVDETGIQLIQNLIDILTVAVFEVDRNDRLNWIDSSKVTGANPGIKILSLKTEKFIQNPKIVFGLESEEMVDSLLILQPSQDQGIRDQTIPMSRLKKVGIYIEPQQRIIGTVSSDVSSIDGVIDLVERMNNNTKAQRHGGLARLDGSEGGEDLHL